MRDRDSAIAAGAIVLTSLATVAVFAFLWMVTWRGAL
jgi:hypothetical protein